MANLNTSDLLLKIVAKTADGCINIAGGLISPFFKKEFHREYGLADKASDNAIRSALKRLKKKGCLEKIERKGSISYRITERGKNKIERKIFDRDVWDGKWRVVMFDIPEEEKRIRDNLRNVLIASGFKYFQKSVWLTPFDVLDEVEIFVNDHDLHNKVWYFSSNSLKNDENIIEKFLEN